MFTAGGARKHCPGTFNHCCCAAYMMDLLVVIFKKTISTDVWRVTCP
jgi:hypothetical protein